MSFGLPKLTSFLVIIVTGLLFTQVDKNQTYFGPTLNDDSILLVVTYYTKP